MRLPRFRIRTLMVAVACTALCFGTTPRYLISAHRSPIAIPTEDVIGKAILLSVLIFPLMWMMSLSPPSEAPKQRRR